VQKNDPDKALGVWTTMQEDDHQPSDSFLIELGEFLQASGREVPFAIPQNQSTPKEQQPIDVPEVTPLAQYRQALKKKDWTSALNLKKQ